MRGLTAFVVLMISGLLAATSDAGAQTFTAKADTNISVKPEAEGFVAQLTKSQFHLLTLFDGKGEPKSVVVREAFAQKLNTNAEGLQSDATIEFWRMDANRKFTENPTQRVTISNVHACKFENDYWVAETHACCDGELYGRLYAYGEVTPFLRYNLNFWTVEIPNTSMTRYVSLVLRDHVPNADAAKAIFGSREKAVAAVILAERGRPLATLYLEPKSGVSQDAVTGLHSGEVAVTTDHSKNEIRKDQRHVTMWTLDGANAANKNNSVLSGASVSAEIAMPDGTGAKVRAKITGDKFLDATVDSPLLQVVGEAGKTLSE